MSSLHCTSHTARSWGCTPTFILVKLIYQFEGIAEMFFLFLLLWKMVFMSVPFHQSIHGFIVLPQKGTLGWKKIKIEKKKKRKKTFDCPIGSLTAAVVSNHRKLPFSNHITFIWETVACSLQPKAGRIWFCWLCKSNSHIFFVFTF